MATLGWTGEGGALISQNDTVRANRYTSPADAEGTFRSISVYCDMVEGETIYAAIYSDNGGVPGVPLTTGSLAGDNDDLKWRVVPVTEIEIQVNTSYWLCVQFSNAGQVPNYRYTTDNAVPAKIWTEANWGEWDNNPATQNDQIFGFLRKKSFYAIYSVEPTPIVLPRPPSVRMRGPLFSLSARGWLGKYSYRIRYTVRNPYPIGFLPTIYRTYNMPAFSLHPYPQFISQYYSTAGWIYERRRTWHGIIWIAMAGYLNPISGTPAQDARRQKFAQAVAGWQALTGLEKGIWNSYSYPKHPSGYNRYIRAYMRDLPH